MRALAIVSAAALAAACAPFEHGHYASDVGYRNTAGDPAGTPLVFNLSEDRGATHVADKEGRHRGKGDRWLGHGTPAYRPAPQGYATAYAPATTYAQPSYVQTTHHAPVTTHYAQPATYAASTYGAPRVGADGYLVCEEELALGAYAGAGVAQTYRPGSYH